MRSGIAIGLGLLAAATLLVHAPAAAEHATAQARVTIFARPTVVGWAQTATLYGAAQGAQHDDVVVIESKDCGSGFFRTFVELHPAPGGGWTTPVGTGITSTFRAVWKSTTSAQVTIRQGANVALERRRSGRATPSPLRRRRASGGSACRSSAASEVGGRPPSRSSSSTR